MEPSLRSVDPAGHWVTTWGAAQQLCAPTDLPAAPFTRDTLAFADSTLRQTLHCTLGGQRIRLRFCNVFGDSALHLDAVSIALPSGGRAGVSAIHEGTSRPVTFAGSPGVAIPAGAQIFADPLDFTIAPGSNVTVTAYLAQGQHIGGVTTHPGSRTTSYLLAGAHVDDHDLPGALASEHWYFLSGIEVRAAGPAAAVIMLGDSLTDGRGSTTNHNNRWPDLLFPRLHADPDTAHVAIVNQATGGNRVLNDGLGPSAVARLDRDVLSQSGARWLVVFEGVNDIGTADAVEPAQKEVVDSLITAYDQIITRARAHGLRVYAATLPPFGGNCGYDDAGGLREQSRQAVNDWVRTSGRFDAVIDFDAVTRDPHHPRQLLANLDDGDRLHLNPTGFQVLADAVPLWLFRPQTMAPTSGSSPLQGASCQLRPIPRGIDIGT